MEVSEEHGGRHLRLEFEVEFTDSEGPQQYHDAIDELTTLWGVRLNEIMVEEAMIRPDGKGTAVYTGGLTDDIAINGILKDEWDYVVVGTTVDYAERLARGLPDPSADYEDILDWVRIKDLPPNMKKGYRKKSKARAQFAKNVTNKMRTDGPIPNPFDQRAVRRFMDEWEDYISEVYL